MKQPLPFPVNVLFFRNENSEIEISFNDQPISIDEIKELKDALDNFYNGIITTADKI